MNIDFYNLASFETWSNERKLDWHKLMGCTESFAHCIVQQNTEYKLSYHERLVFQAHELRRKAFISGKFNWRTIKPISLTQITVLDWQQPHDYFFRWAHTSLCCALFRQMPGKPPYRTNYRKFPYHILAKE